ncbi:pentraxin-related protein PTX3 [Anoplopoma fimbria]|uniref:pentraxin-related protein PTX3 n=1 Tax=Anoplopoma fimbria TaxID=229290 RepID=UPI0023EC7A8D|nr:pentraxin-related protein PTX3 [Anoplopoma fimbria]
MFRWRLPQAVCALSVCMCLILAYEDDIEVNYADSYFNEITVGETPEPTPSQTPCSSPDLTKWDKIFSMLENSQMRENMLLQYADDIIKVEMGSLRGELLRFIAQYGASCGVAMETAGRRMTLQLEGRLRETLERHRPREQRSSAAGNGNSNHLVAMLQQILSAAQTQNSRLAKLETSCFGSPGAGMGSNTNTGSQPPEAGGAGLREQEVTSRVVALDRVLAAMQQAREELGEVLRSSRQRKLPAGCEMALFFPVRSHQICTSVTPEVPLSISAFTVCMWVKPTAVFNRTVLLSYGTRNNPYEIQLLLGETSAFFTIGGEAHLVEARDVVNPGGEWSHLCGSWSSEQGLASLWAGGKKVTTTPGVAEGHVLPKTGSLQLGQETVNWLTRSDGFNPKMAFVGKMTGVNMWDRVLSEEEISQLALQESQHCDRRGNVVAWGVTEMVPQGEAQFIY